RICVCSWHPKIRDTSGWATNHQRSRTDTHSATPKRCHPERSEGSAFALGTPKSAILPSSPQPANDPEPARIPRLQSAVILNAVKDLRLLLASQNPRNFRVGHHPPATPSDATKKPPLAFCKMRKSRSSKGTIYSKLQ